MEPLLSAKQMEQADRYTINDLGICDLVLMEHAASAVVGALEDRFGDILPDTKGFIVAGSGNNGGDAFAAARILHSEGCPNVVIYLCGNREKLSPGATAQLKVVSELGIPVLEVLDESLLEQADWIIDGIFGTGLSRNVEGKYAGLIEKINTYAEKKWIVAVDIPSGLSADTGNPLGCAVQASETVTFGFLKKGLVTGQAADYVGTITLDPIQIPREIPSLRETCFLYEEEDAKESVPARRPSGHKGDHGHVYVWAGVEDKEGACALSCLASLRTGNGLTTLVGDRDLGQIKKRLAVEVMSARVGLDLFSKQSKQVLALGPGMGLTADRWKVLKSALASDWSLVLDADALTLISKNETEAQMLFKKRESAITILTPHPKEASRLLGEDLSSVLKDRYGACQRLVKRFGCHILLKGKGTIIGGPELPLFVVDAGDTSLSKGGSGDVLTGVLASLLAQKVPAEEAVPLGAYIHGRASEILSARLGTERSSLSSEIAGAIPAVWAELEA